MIITVPAVTLELRTSTPVVEVRVTAVIDFVEYKQRTIFVEAEAAAIRGPPIAA